MKFSINHGVDTGTADAYTMTLFPTPDGYTDGLLGSFTPTHTNLTTTPTLSISSFGPVTMTSANASVALSAGQIATTQICLCVYSATANKFLVLTPA